MKITSVTLHNYRCFEQIELVLEKDHNIHVILADNMSGKTALMRALCITCRAYISKLVPQIEWISRSDHRVIGHNPINDITLDVYIKSKALLSDMAADDCPVEWTKFKSTPEGRTTTKLLSNSIDPAQIARDVYNRAIEGKATLPLFNYIGTEYLHLTSSETISLDLNGDALQGYKDCLGDKSIKKFLFTWLGRIDGIIKEKAYKKIVSQAYGDLPDDAMFVFQEAVKKILDDVEEIEWLEDKKQPIIQFKNGDVRLFDMLSDGYRYLILLAGELATRAIILNKHHGKDVLKKINGVVLIDEFGIHLHPSLQSQALKRLQEAFPLVQFIITTHSPLLINGLKKEQIHILEINKDGTRSIRQPEVDVIGLGADGILLEMFGLATTYDDVSIGWNDEYRTLFEKKNASLLTADETKRFNELSLLLANIRLDPTLHINNEDYITRTVREKLDLKNKRMRAQNRTLEGMDQEIDEILNEIFAKEK